MLLDPERLFLLWLLRDRPQTSLNDLEVWFGAEFPLDELAKGLQQDGFLLLDSGKATLTDAGRQVADCLAEDEPVSGGIAASARAFLIAPLSTMRVALARTRVLKYLHNELLPRGSQRPISNRIYMRARKRASRRAIRAAVLATLPLIIVVGYFILKPDGESPAPGTARLEGIVTDRSGNPLPNMSVGIRNGPAANTDTLGKFVVNNVAAGGQIIVVKPPSGGGQLTQHVELEAGKTTRANVVYDASTSQLGLLSITAPVDDSSVEARQVDGRGKTTVHGRCDGLARIFDRFNIWVLVKPETATAFFVQHPPAIVNHQNGTWMMDIWLGEPDHPARNGDRWTIIAVAAGPDSGINRIASTPSLNLLPPHLESNVVTFVSEVKVSQQNSIPVRVQVTGDIHRSVYDPFVERVAEILRRNDMRVFYDRYEEVSSWEKNLRLLFHKVYRARSKYVVRFISQHWHCTNIQSDSPGGTKCV